MSNDLSVIYRLNENLRTTLKQANSKDAENYFLEIGDKENDQDNFNSYCQDNDKNVVGLNLSGIEFESIPIEVMELKNLQLLDISNSNLTFLSQHLYDLKNLRALYLSSNKLVTMPKGISKLTQLNTLSLHSNRFETFPTEIIQLRNLELLFLNNNRINKIPVNIYKFSNFSNLRILNLASNRIRELPTTIIKLNLRINWVYEADGIILWGNPLESPPIEIVRKGNNAIFEYFKSIEGEKEAINEVKVILIGDGGSGKTSLVKQLLGEKFNKDEPQTHGINIRNLNAKKNGNDIIVHFWDFGGQEIMHATHQFFLSKRSLYILVLDGRKDEKTEYWLKHIESFGGDSPILVVLNKIDENPAFDVNRKFLKEKYKGIRGFFKTSCAELIGIKNFSKNLVDELSSIEILKTTWAKSWFNVKSELETMAKPFISFEEYTDLCTNLNVTEESSQDTLVEFLHDLGVIIHFKNIKLLDTHVIDPKWVTEAVYKIINSKELSEGKGKIKVSLLNKILKKQKKEDYYYPPDKYGFIIDLMVKFELCYEIDNQTILIPDLLEIQEPNYDFDFDSSLKFIFEYDFLPKAVMPRFMVRMHKDVMDNLIWKSGVLLQDDDSNCVAIVRSDESEKKIFIYVNGESKRIFFSVIRRTFREINQSFEKFEVTELVPLPNYPETTIKYRELIGLERMKEPYVTIGELGVKYSVKQLLDGIEKEDDRKKDILDIQESSVYHIHDSNVIIGKKEKQVSKNVINIGDGATFHGDFMVGNKIKDSFNKAESSDAPDELKELLKSLSTEVAKMADKMPKEEAEQVADDLETFTKEAIKEKPRQKWWQLSAEGLKDAAKTVGEIGLSVIRNLDKIIPILEKIS